MLDHALQRVAARGQAEGSAGDDKVDDGDSDSSDHVSSDDDDGNDSD